MDIPTCRNTHFFYVFAPFLSPREVKLEDTPFGMPSGPLLEGQICGVPVYMLARHGTRHTVLPADINYRANIYAFKVTSYIL